MPALLRMRPKLLWPPPVRLAWPRLLRRLSMVYPKERLQSRLINSFAAFAKERIASLQAEGATRAVPLLRAVQPVDLRSGKPVNQHVETRRPRRS